MILLLFTFVSIVQNSSFFEVFGGSKHDYGRSVQQTSDGGYIVAGYTQSWFAGVEDVFLSKFNSDGSQSWTKTLGGPSGDFGMSVQQTSDGGYIVTGYTFGFGTGGCDVLLSKFKADGSHSWTKTLGGSMSDVGRSVQQTSDGGYIVTGFTSSSGHGLSDLLLSKFNADGSHNWTMTLGGSSDDYGRSVQQTSDGGYIVTGNTRSFGAGNDDVLLSKFNANGSHNWTKTIGGSGYDDGYSVQQTSDGGFILTGETSSFGSAVYNLLLSKFNADGSHSWTKTLDGGGGDFGYSVQQTTDGGYIVTGKTSSYGGGGCVVLLSKFNASGSHNWTRTLGGDGADTGRSVQQISDGGYIVAGYTNSYGGDNFCEVLISRLGSGGEGCMWNSSTSPTVKSVTPTVSDQSPWVGRYSSPTVGSPTPTIMNIFPVISKKCHEKGPEDPEVLENVGSRYMFWALPVIAGVIVLFF